ncbi:MAG TPA: hypothetical protein VE944_01000 [Nostoc sp.]|uniref:hypothetical protein n=1 Tax=Nostoc sp. TaxID=1180 RepID=UPI002D34CAC6|nr:hypothetical protein [Nostoc sp.]HYX12950.1 hypothetical protein [Nostoc sp.]
MNKYHLKTPKVNTLAPDPLSPNLRPGRHTVLGADGSAALGVLAPTNSKDPSTSTQTGLLASGSTGTGVFPGGRLLHPDFAQL